MGSYQAIYAVKSVVNENCAILSDGTFFHSALKLSMLINLLCVQDYSTTSLEFSDVESLVSDSVGRQSEDEIDWTESRHHGTEELTLDRQPVGFVEFTPANTDDDRVDERTRQSRSVNNNNNNNNNNADDF